jgi:hypothetical protein
VSFTSVLVRFLVRWATASVLFWAIGCRSRPTLLEQHNRSLKWLHETISFLSQNARYPLFAFFSGRWRYTLYYYSSAHPCISFVIASPRCWGSKSRGKISAAIAGGHCLSAYIYTEQRRVSGVSGDRDMDIDMDEIARYQQLHRYIINVRVAWCVCKCQC